MKRISALLFIVLVTRSLAYCGDGEKPLRRIYFGFSVTPDVSYRYLVSNYIQPGSSSAANQSAIANDNSQGHPQFGINAQVKLGINLTRWLAVESGVGYMLAQYRYQSSATLALGSQWNGTTITSSNDVLTNKERETYSYMTVPIGLRLSIGHRKVRGIIAPGIDLDFLLQKKEVSSAGVSGGQMSTTTTDETKNFNTFNVSPYLGVGVDCYLSPRVVLRLMPVAQIDALKNINTPISEYLWSVGFNVSLLFGL